MGKEKAGFLTPKAIGNRIKAKGLQKLRWYCQMCQKQCRDENGFKCHVMSESHQRQLLLVADNPDKFVDSFSKEFCESFLELLKRRFGTKRVHANVVYQEYIADRNHTHMNSTQWETLTEFVKWVGREGFCVVDETEKGWFIQYIDRDPEAIRRQEAHQKKVKMDLDDEEKKARFIQQQIEKAAAEKDSAAAPAPIYTELQKQNDQDKVVFKIPLALDSGKAMSLTRLPDPPNRLLGLSTSKSSKSDDSDTASTISSCSTTSRKRKSALEEIREMEEQSKAQSKAKSSRKDYWLMEGIVVKIVTQKIGEKFYKKKGIVKEVIDRYAAVIKLLDTPEKIKLDQVHLETVIPSIGSPVMMVNGVHRGETAILQSLNEADFSCTVVLQSGLLKRRVIDRVQYEDICKLYQADS